MLVFICCGPFVVTFGLLLHISASISVALSGAVWFCRLHCPEAQWRQKTLLLRFECGLMSLIWKRFTPQGSALTSGLLSGLLHFYLYHSTPLFSCWCSCALAYEGFFSLSSSNKNIAVIIVEGSSSSFTTWRQYEKKMNDCCRFFSQTTDMHISMKWGIKPIVGFVLCRIF